MLLMTVGLHQQSWPGFVQIENQGNSSPGSCSDAAITQVLVGAAPVSTNQRSDCLPIDNQC